MTGQTVNAVAQGFTEPDMTTKVWQEVSEKMRATTPLARAVQPGEVAAEVASLASDGAAYITGAVTNVNGGMYM